MGTTGASVFHLFLPMAILFCRLAHSTEALGGPALRLLLQFAGHGAAMDIVVINLVTAWPLLGTMLLVCFVRKACAGAGVTVTDPFAQVTAAVSVGATLLVTTCSLLVSGVQARAKATPRHSSLTPSSP
jgi:hypothetical protein